jgi:hypothetical protein
MVKIFKPGFTALLTVALAVSIFIGCTNPAAKTTSQGNDPASAGGKYLAQGKYSGAYFPTEGWKACKPEEAGMNSAKLDQAIAYSATPGLTPTAWPSSGRDTLWVKPTLEISRKTHSTSAIPWPKALPAPSSALPLIKA